MMEIFGGERLKNRSTRGKSSQMALVRGYCLLKGPPRLVASFWPAIRRANVFFLWFFFSHPSLPPLPSWWLTSWKLRCVKWPLLYHLALPLPIFIPVTQVIFPQAVTVVAPGGGLERRTRRFRRAAQVSMEFHQQLCPPLRWAEKKLDICDVWPLAHGRLNQKLCFWLMGFWWRHFSNTYFLLRV